jgi:3-hydroxybutyryl-CoA dehydrogenase
MMEISTIGVVGAGQMGNGIAHVAAQAGYQVILTDIDVPTLRRAMEAIRRNLGRQIRRGTVADDDREQIVSRIRTDTRLAAHDECDLVIEAAAERYEIKAEIIRHLDAICCEQTMLASNTSSLSITRLAGETGRPDRFAGMHFMNPVPVMQLIEVVRGLHTSEATHTTICQVAEHMGKTPVSCTDAPGFVSHRLLIPMINEAVFAVQEGVASTEAVDQIARLGLNHPMGPLELADLIGLDTCLETLRMLHKELGDPKFRPCHLLVQMVDGGRLGRKSGRGFYDYTKE